MSLVSRFSGTKFKQMVVFQTICIVAARVYGLKNFSSLHQKYAPYSLYSMYSATWILYEFILILHKY